MHDDLPDCATKPDTYTSVRFVYDYNTRSADLFGEHVGAVTLYLFDNEGHFISEYECTNSGSNALKDPDFKIDLNLEPGVYKVYAVAQGNEGGYMAHLQDLGAKFRRHTLTEGESWQNFYISLDHTMGLVPHQNVMLETLWTTLEARELVVPVVEEPAEGDPQQDDILVQATVPLMRVTNELHLSFYQQDFPGNINPDDYEVWVASERGRDKLNLLGEYLADAEKLTFNAHRVYTATDAEGHACVNMEFGLPRFMMHTDEADRAKLHVRNKITGYESVFDLPRELSRGRAAYADKNWSEQEYLDREYQYDLALCLTDKSWKFLQVNVLALSWSKRVQNADL